ncbi:bifunctional folylpolyglutamate synthase/dihydrofolate synthase [Sphingomonas lenta]|uniref:Dihydrofolate synthase/folylpolyglutamate synthase n=1 Tax=Sphingomonas lenta TaxID=1141887 RepID=A0A2A2SHM8_9SPHN|nr:folylpolyglutamate synthase/dihydrofolate synthase family protein [Sphingomonas lenta]PAX08531.1 bifunctional folylpolyglutamate synthase/dihydrofolate synthase [Sphingomonas lenta]
MPDHARSSDPAVQAQLDRLWRLSPGADVLGLDRITRLLARLGDPHRHLPPVLHVAGTNGKGSTCAFLRAALEAAGYKVHAYTSPHLVRFNERIRLAGNLITDAQLAPLLAEVLDRADGVNASFFEVTTAAAFLAFARTPADACVVEVGLGGRLDATNVLADPAATGIAALGIDHQAFLGDTAVQIAREKAGIAEPGRPLMTLAYPDPIAAAVQEVALAAGAPVLAAERDWRFTSHPDHVRYEDATGALDLPLPVLPGRHQHANLALAVAMLRHQDRIVVPDAALQAAATGARWPARMQRLRPGPLTALLPEGAELWLDGGHNEDAAAAIAPVIAAQAQGRPVHLVLGLLANKDMAGVLRHLAPIAGALTAVPVPDHAHHAPADLAEAARGAGVPVVATAPDVPAALAQADAPVVLIAGSLYLAGAVLAANDEPPD